MLTPNETYSSEERNWNCPLSELIITDNSLLEDSIDTKVDSKHFEFFENGLIKDAEYYKPFNNVKFYLALFKRFSLTISEIESKEFESLKDDGWLFDNVVTIGLHLFNKNGKFQIVEQI